MVSGATCHLSSDPALLLTVLVFLGSLFKPSAPLFSHLLNGNIHRGHHMGFCDDIWKVFQTVPGLKQSKCPTSINSYCDYHPSHSRQCPPFQRMGGADVSLLGSQACGAPDSALGFLCQWEDDFMPRSVSSGLRGRGGFSPRKPLGVKV